jgi:hypothetical protein
MSCNIFDLDMSLGHSHRCHECHCTFLKKADGCPNCGSDVITSPLPNNRPSIPDDAEIISEVTYNFETGKFS